MHRHQLDDRDAQLLQVRDLFDQTGIGSPDRFSHTARATGSESFDMELIDNRVGEMQWRFVSVPIEICRMKTKNPERCLTRIWPWAHGGFAIKCGREVNSLCVGVEQQFLRIKSVPRARAIIDWTVHAIGVVAGAAKIFLFQSTMPDAFSLVTQRL